MKRILCLFLCALMVLPQVVYASYPYYVETDMSDADRALQEVIVLSVNSCGMLVNGALRYVDDDDLTVTPVLRNAVTYIPLSAAEEMFNAYIEEQQDSIYIDFRYENDTWNEATGQVDKLSHRLIFGKNSVTADFEQTNSEGYLVYLNGRAYIALRRLAEFLGKTVTYYNHHVVIGEEEFVSKLVQNDEYFNYARLKLDPFRAKSYEGNVYFVSPSGGDDGIGTLEEPMSLKRASSIAKSGDVVYLRGGIYRETLIPKNNGEPSAPIIYKAYNDEKPVISTADELCGFSKEGQFAVAQCEIDLGYGRNQVFYNGECISEARYPNWNKDDYDIDDISNLFAPKGNLKLQADDCTVANKTDEELSVSDNNRWAGAIFVSLHGNAWTLSTAEISSSAVDADDATVETLTLNTNKVSQRWWYDVAEDSEGSYGYIIGAEAAIDAPGEWILKDGELKLLPPEKVDISSLTVEVKARQLCVDISDRKFIHIDGIELFGGSINAKDGFMNVIKNCKIRYGNHYTFSYDQGLGMVDSSFPKSVTRSENAAQLRGEAGCYFSGENDVIKNNTFDTAAAAAIYLTGLYTKVWNNNINNCGYMGSFVGGIHIAGDGRREYNSPYGGHIIRYNTVRNSSRSAFTLQARDEWHKSGQQPVYIPCEISNNVFANGGINAIDTGVVYIQGARLSNDYRRTKFRNNIVYADGTPSGTLIGMIYYDNWSQYAENYNNIIFCTKDTITYQKNVYIQNNQAYLGTSHAIVYNWNNEMLGVYKGGIENLPDESYPDGLPFKCGFKQL